MTRGEPVIDVEGLTVGLGLDTVQEDLSFRVARGDIFVILGRSGCGKSTVLRHLMGLEAPRAGRITIEGEDPRVLVTGPPRFGAMFQNGALLGSLTVGQNVALPLRTWTRLPEPAIAAIVDTKLGMVGLRGVQTSLPSELSGGMRKRAALARALALEPRLVFLDEPSAGLDPVTAAELDELILTLNRGLELTVVLVTHELRSIFRVATRCIMLDKDDKRIIAEGDPHVLRDDSDDPRVGAFFRREGQAKSP